MSEVPSALDILMSWLCQTIYPLIAYAYRVFYNIGTLRIIDDENIKPIYNRITLILGLVMLFVVIFQLIQYIMQPDNFTDKEKGFGKVMYRMIISIALIAFVPNLFDLAFGIQSDIMDNYLIPTLILGDSGDEYNEDWGNKFSGDVLSRFYQVNPNATSDYCDGVKNYASTIVNANISSLKENGSLGSSLTLCLGETDKGGKENIIKFDGIIAVLCGGLILWMLIMYCLDLGTRVIQLSYLQIIAPIPIIMYILPKKDGAFEKWVKQCLTTFLDLFIRTALICFVVLIISTLGASFDDITENVSGKGDALFESILYICLVLGVMTFAKKAGDMLKELFPKGNAASGELGLSTKNRIPEPARRLAGAGIGFGVAGVWGGVRKTIGGVRSAANANKKTRDQLNNSYENAKNEYKTAKKEHDDLVKNHPNNTKEIEEANKNMLAKKKTMKEEKSKLDYEKAVAVGRGVLAAPGSFITGTLSGASKGLKAGFTTKGGLGGITKATAAVSKENRAIDEWRENGGTTETSRVISGVMQSMGFNPTEKYDRKKEDYDKENAAYDEYDKCLSAAKERAVKKLREGAGSNAARELFTQSQTAKSQAEVYKTQAGNLKITDFGSEAEYNAEVNKLISEAQKKEEFAITTEKKASEQYVQDVMDGKDGNKDDAVLQSIETARNILRTNSRMKGFTKAIADTLTKFEGLSGVNNDAKAAKSENVNNLMEEQNSPEFLAAQANKKYHEQNCGKK